MRLSSFNRKLILLILVLIPTSIWVYAASTITNPLCSLQQVTNYPQNFFDMTSISGDGTRTAVGHFNYYEIWNLSNNSRITILDNAEFPVLDYDGSRVAFVSTGNLTGQNADGSYELFLWNNNIITQLSNLTGEHTLILVPDISDDGTKIVFAVDTVGNYLDLGGGTVETKYYIWREGSGVSPLFGGASQAATSAWAYTPVRISTNGNTAVFLYDGQLNAGAPVSGGVYRINLLTEQISFLFGRSDFDDTFEFMFIDGDASRITFGSTENYSGLNPSNALRLWVWDEFDGFRIISNGSGTPIHPVVYPMGFSADGNRVLFTSGYNPTGENPDGSMEFYIYEYSNNSIRQISSRTGIPYLTFGFEALSATGQSAAIMLPTGTDYDSDDYDYFHDMELFEANCTESRPSPSNLRITAVSQTSVSLAWNDNALGEAQYRLERSANGISNWTEIASLNANSTSYNNTGLSCSSSYFYRVRAYWNTGLSYSEYSPVMGATTSSCPSPTNAPDNLYTTDISATTIDLAWDDNASDETAYYVERSANNGTDWSEIASLAANVTSYSDTVACNKTYMYRVRVSRIGSGGYVAYSESISASSETCPAPIAPGNLAVTATGKTSVSLSWFDNSSNETNFYIERSSDNGSTWTALPARPANTSSYTVVNLGCETNYQFRIRAYLNGTYSEYSNVVSATTTACVTPPAPPTNLHAGTTSRTSIQVIWTDNANDETNYRVERSDDNGVSWSQVATVNANGSSFTNTSLTCATSYQYRVRAYKSTNSLYSNYSSVLTVATQDCLLPPNVPENFQVAVIDETSVQLSWNLSANANSYYLEKSTDGGTSWQFITTPSASTSSYIHIADCNTTYHYRIRAYRTAVGYSSYSDAISGTTPACTSLFAPSNFQVTAVTTTTISLSWDNSPNESSYNIQYSLDNGVTWQHRMTLGANLVTHTDFALTCNTSYQYRIRIYRSLENQYSEFSEPITGTTAACPNAPGNLEITSVGAYSIGVSWLDTNTDEFNYRLERSLDGVSWSQAASRPANTTIYTYSPLLCETNYYLRVRAYRNTDGQYSVASNVVTATTGNCPYVPTNFHTTAQTRNSITLNWDDTNTDESYYRVIRSFDGVVSSAHFNTAVNATGFTDSNLTCGMTYLYKVSAYRAGDDRYSANTDWLSVSTSPCPPAPTNLQVTSISETSVTLAWEDNASDETNYLLEYSLNGTTWSYPVFLSANITSVNYTDLECGTNYFFRLRTRSGSNYSEYSNVVNVTTSPCPNTPTNLTVTNLAENSVSLSWDDNATDETGYTIHYSYDGGLTFHNLTSSITANSTSYTHSNILCNRTYHYKVIAHRSGIGSSEASNVVEATTLPCLPLVAPSNLEVMFIWPNTISFEWDDSNADENNFAVEISSDNGQSWTQFSFGSGTGRTSVGLICETSYQYRVRAYRSGDSSYSPYSDVLSASTGACVPLDTPANLRMTSSDQISINLAWNDSNADETNHQLEVSADNGASWTVLPATAITGYNHTGLSCAQTYQYRVRTYRSVDNSYSAYSNLLTASTTACPAAPSNLRVYFTTSFSIRILWTINTGDATYNYVERSTDGGTTWTQIGTVSATLTSYDDVPLSCATSYQYRVRAYKSSTNMYSSYSNVLTASTANCSSQPLVAPSNFIVIGLGSNNINLGWTDNSTDESYFELWRKTGDGSYSLLLTLSANMTAYNDTSVSCDTVYSYILIANRLSDNYERAISLTNVSTAACPGVPLNFRTSSVTPANVALAWDDNSSNETSFSIERKSTGNWAVIASPLANTTSFNDTTVECGQSYQYRIRTYWISTNSYSPFSAVLTVNVPVCPPLNAPTSLNLVAASQNSITLRWTDNASDETNYHIERSIDGGTSWTQLATVSGAVYTHAGLACESSSQYRVRGYRNLGNTYSEYSNVLTASTAGCPVAAPSNPLVTSSTFGLSLSWTDNADNETDFELQQNTAGNWQTIATLPINSTSLNLTGLLCQTNYAYRLRAYKSSTATYSSWLNINGTTSNCPVLQASVLSGTSTDTSINLSWTVDSTAQSLTLSYFTGAQWISLGTFNSASTSFSHTGLGCGQSYQYRLLSHRSQDNSSILSNTLTISTLACAPLAAPAAPVILNTQSSLVSLQIPAMPAGASSMNLERSLDGVNWLGIGLASGNYMDVNVICATTYHYRLVAYRASDGQYSPASASVSTTTPACPVAVSMIIGVYHQGAWSFVDSNATSNPASSFNFGDASWQPLVGDWDGDGVDGIGLYRNGEFVLRSVVAGLVQESRFNFGDSAGYQAVAGDWNGDGIDTIGVFGNGQFILSDDHINVHYRFNLGDGSGWVPVAGDWDGNGADGVALYKEGYWYLVDSVINPQMQTIAYGPAQAAWLPVAGDWNGDGRDTIGLYNNGLWRIRLESNTGGAEGSFFFGTAGDSPLSTFEGGIPSGAYSSEPFIVPTAAPEPSPELTPEATSES